MSAHAGRFESSHEGLRTGCGLLTMKWWYELNNLKTIKAISKKYDGSLRDKSEELLLVTQDSDTIVLLMPPGTKEYSYRQQAWVTADDGLLQIFFTNRWYNVWHIAEQKSNFNHLYANIAMPAHWVKGVLEWVDLDLDIRMHMDGSIEVLDEDEFVYNQIQMQYPQEVVTKARAATEEALHLLQHGLYPFDHEIQVARYWRLRRG